MCFPNHSSFQTISLVERCFQKTSLSKRTKKEFTLRLYSKGARQWRPWGFEKGDLRDKAKNASQCFEVDLNH